MTQVDRMGTPGSIDARMMQRANSPPAAMPSPPLEKPTQLKVKVKYDAGNYTTTLIVPLNITYQSLKDRIDAKLQRSTAVSLASGLVKLKYMDDGDKVSVQDDDDVQEAFDTWREQEKNVMAMGEVVLYIE